MSILIVEDEYLIATDFAEHLRGLGAGIIGPAPNADRVRDLLEAGADPDAAVLDIDLSGDRVNAIAHMLDARQVRIVFVSGFDRDNILKGFEHCPFFEKPANPLEVAKALRGS